MEIRNKYELTFFEKWVFENKNTLLEMKTGEEKEVEKVALLKSKETGSKAQTPNGPIQSLNRVFVAGKFPLLAKTFNENCVLIERREKFDELDYATKRAYTEGKRMTYEEPSDKQRERVQAEKMRLKLKY